MSDGFQQTTTTAESSDALLTAKRRDIWANLAWWTILATIFTVPLAIGMIPFGETLMWGFASVPKALVLWFGVACASVLFVGSLIFERRTLRWHWSLWLVVASIIGIAFSTFLAKDIYYAVFGNGDELVGTLSLLSLAGLLYLLVQLADSESRQRQMLKCIALSGVLVAAVSLTEQVLRIYPFTPVFVPDSAFIQQRGGSLMGNPDVVGGFLVMPAILWLGFMLKAKAIKRKYLYGTFMVLTSAATVFTMQRAAWVGLIVGLVLVYVTGRRDRVVSWKVPVVSVVLVLCAIGASAFVLPTSYQLMSKITTIVSDITSPAAFSRPTLIKESMDIVGDSPFVGVGPANYRLGWYENRSEATIRAARELYVSDSHSVPFYLAATIGLPMTLLLLIFCGLVLWRSTVQMRRTEGYDLIQAMLITTLSAMIVVSLASITTVVLLMVLVVPVGLLMARDVTREQGEVTDMLSKGGAMLCSVALSIVLIGGAVVTASAYITTDEAQDNTNAEAGALAFLEAGTEFPYIADASRVGIETASKQIEAQRTPLDEGIEEIALQAIDRHPRDIDLAKATALYQIRSGLVATDFGQLSRGIELAERILSNYPYDTGLTFSTAVALANAGEIERAQVLVERYRSMIDTNEQMNALEVELVEFKKSKDQE